MHARTLGRVPALIMAVTLFVAATWVVATQTAVDTGPDVVSNTNTRSINDATLKEYFLPTLKWNDVEGAPVGNSAPGDKTLREYFLPRLIWDQEVGPSNGDTP